MMHFPLFQIFPLFSKNFQTVGIFYLNFRIPPYFPCFNRPTFSPLFRENYYSPPTFKNAPCFRKIHLFLHTLCVFRFPPTLTMMHLCITQCTYWTPLQSSVLRGTIFFHPYLGSHALADPELQRRGGGKFWPKFLNDLFLVVS